MCGSDKFKLQQGPCSFTQTGYYHCSFPARLRRIGPVVVM